MIQVWASDVLVDLQVIEDKQFGDSARCRGCGERAKWLTRDDQWEPHTLLECLQRMREHAHEEGR